MTHSYIGPTDDELDQKIVDFLRPHIVKMVKAPLVAGMAAFSVWVLSDSLLKALAIAMVCVVLSAFNTWRRFLDPLAFWCFVFAVVYWCEPDSLSKIRALVFA